MNDRDIQHNLFLSTVCNPCVLSPINGTVEPKKLLQCLGCKLILYCSAAHQKLDWPIHKQFCKAVSKIIAENEVNHLFEIAGPIKSKSDLSAVTVKVKYKLISLLKRPLDYHEEELTSFPVMCASCFSTKYNKLFQCKACRAVSYCCSDHEIKEAPNHQSECIPLKLYYCKFKIDSNSTFKLKLKETCKLLEFDLQKVMEKMFEIDFASDPTLSLVEYKKFSFVSDFSCVATVSYFVEYLKSYQKLGKEFTLFVAGSTIDHIWFTPLHTEFFLICFPEVVKFNIVFIGPEIPTGSFLETKAVLSNGRSFHRTLYQGTFESYFKKNSSMRPDLVACFNCGFSENATNDGPSDSWHRGIKYFMQIPNIPILFTSYTSLEAINDFRALEQVVENENQRLHCLIAKQQNPYRDMRPLRNWLYNDPEKIFYRNGYVQAVRIQS